MQADPENITLIEIPKSKLIPLTQGLFTTVDEADYPYLSQFKWHADKRNKTFYARGYVGEKGKKAKRYMHRVITNASEEMEVDHEDHDGLNNRRYNIRVCTHHQNQMGQDSVRGTSSQFKGVTWQKKKGKWRTQIMYEKKLINLGYFLDEIEAAKAYDKKAKELFGEFAKFNFPTPLASLLQATSDG
jgi:hypothetical protein